jgi:hypothetical protein
MKAQKSVMNRWRWIPIWVILPILVLTSLPGQALKYRPRGRVERPSQQEAAGSRGPCWRAGVKPFFAPLVTATNYGETIADYPTFYWLAANHNYVWARFELFATQNLSAAKYPDYSTTLRIQETQKVSSLTLSAESGFPPLQLNQEYLWKVTFICSPDGPDSEFAAGSEIAIQGWIKRVAPTPVLKAALANPKGRALYNIYAEAGLWYDSVHDLATHYRSHPKNPDLIADWQRLLKLLSLQTNQIVQQLRP